MRQILPFVAAWLMLMNTALAQEGQDDGPGRLVPEAAGIEHEWRPFSSVEAGIELLVPPGERHTTDDSSLLVLVIDSNRNWRYELRRLVLEMPMELEGRDLPEGGRLSGLLDAVITNMQMASQGDVLRQGLAPLGDADAATVTIRTSMGLNTHLRQVALIKGTSTLYYQIIMTSPAPSGPVEELAQDPGVREAVAAFNRSFNSFRLLDQRQLREEQDERLLRTRTLFVNLTKARLIGALQGEQWWRIRRNGMDIGYSYLVEEPARDIPSDPHAREQVDPLSARGVRIGIRTRLRREGGWLDRETWMFAASESNNPEAQVTGFKEEDFRERNQLTIDGEQRAENVVVGMMRGRRVPQRIRVPREGGVGYHDQVDLIDQRRLEVTFVINGTQTGNPLTRQLPAWYVPMAIEHLLPRIVARWDQNTYLVAVYHPERREVFQQYIDVEGLRSENIQGEQRLVMVVTTRMGLTGAKTRHFIEPEGYRWVGSVNEGDGLEIWPTDAETLRKIWQEPDLTPPDPRQRS